MLNAKNAVRKLSRLVNANFTEDDYTVTLEYTNALRPNDISEVKKDVRNYMRRLRNFYLKNGILVFKYIVIFESGEVRGNIHVHVIVKGGVDRNEIEKLWGKGTANTKRLQPEYYDGLDRITSYMQKAPLGVRHWIGSKNLDKPIEPTPETITRRTARNTIDALDYPEKVEKLFPGMRVLKYEERWNEVNSSFYCIIDLIAIGGFAKCKKKE